MVVPREYTIKILEDTNGNGKWDTGDFEKLLQPERVILLPKKLSLRADWDNESDIIINSNSTGK